MSISIIPFVPVHASAVAELVLSIQSGEFGFDVSLSDQPDLADIPGNYLVGAGGFWLALDSDRVVGCIGLMDLGSGDGSLRKMFVALDHRGAGIAQRLLDTLHGHARTSGIKRLYLGTTSSYHAAHRFYEKNGYQRIEARGLPSGFPRFEIEDRFYALF